MPKDTFFNLPEEKRKMIVSVAVDEFAANSYEQASINQIVAEAGIAKGSFYQYFDDKKDLFFHLLDLMVEIKATYISPFLSNPEEHDFFTLLREIYLAGLQFAVDHPKYTEVGNRLLEDKNAPMFQEYAQANSQTAADYFSRLIDIGQARNEIRADIDRQLLIYMVTSLNELVITYHASYISKEYDKTMMYTLDTFIDFLKHGIASNQQNGAE
jgi:AcrR family transcriptional regulator